ncbi:hypothetical protein [Neosynechococcus sphagnicola]|nr:hypothetical protein [Neosynechococcus sphagnicola]
MQKAQQRLRNLNQNDIQELKNLRQQVRQKLNQTHDPAQKKHYKAE